MCYDWTSEEMREQCLGAGGGGGGRATLICKPSLLGVDVGFYQILFLSTETVFD